jgi:hypothetical protein
VTKPQFKPCDRCGRRGRSLGAMAEWNVVVERGVVTGLICDRCQTSEEFTEAETNHATLDYKVIDGRLAGRLKGVG